MDLSEKGTLSLAPFLHSTRTFERAPADCFYTGRAMQCRLSPYCGLFPCAPCPEMSLHALPYDAPAFFLRVPVRHTCFPLWTACSFSPD